LPDIDALTATLGRLGIANNVQVVVYDQDTGSWASRLWWLLRYAGHQGVAVLDGGWTAWTREGRPTRSGEEQRSPPCSRRRQSSSTRCSWTKSPPQSAIASD
jgi:thiosulfate/3-mercaptopyruvate sulfurtransferase